MQFERRQLSGGKSPLVLAGRGDGSSGHLIYLRVDNKDRALQSPSRDNRTWRAAIASSSALMVKAAAGLAACAEAAFPNLLLAVMSWTIAHALAGCAAYAEAMYPGVFQPDEQINHRHPAGEFEAPDQPRPSPPAQVSATAVQTGYMARPEAARADSPGWGASLTSLVAGFRSAIRRRRDRRLAILELRALDDRSLRDIGISRCDIEYFVRRGDRCE